MASEKKRRELFLPESGVESMFEHWTAPTRHECKYIVKYTVVASLFGANLSRRELSAQRSAASSEQRWHLCPGSVP